MKTEDKNTFSYRLRTVRKENKLTQAKFAERVGVEGARAPNLNDLA
jgi:transcriptional regulator with XRE-family HTH domain